MPKRYYSQLSSSKLPPVIKTTGLLMVVGMWEYGNQAITYISHKIQNTMHTNKLDNLASWFSVEAVTAITLGSQIFIKACGSHSPAINYIEKSIIGLEYYIFTAGGSAVTKSTLDSSTNWDTNIKIWTSTAIGVFTGAVIGGFAQGYTEKHLDKAMGYVDGSVGVIIGAITGASTAIIGDYSHIE